MSSEHFDSSSSSDLEDEDSFDASKMISPDLRDSKLEKPSKKSPTSSSKKIEGKKRKKGDQLLSISKNKSNLIENSVQKKHINPNSTYAKRKETEYKETIRLNGLSKKSNKLTAKLVEICKLRDELATGGLAKHHENWFPLNTPLWQFGRNENEIILNCSLRHIPPAVTVRQWSIDKEFWQEMGIVEKPDIATQPSDMVKIWSLTSLQIDYLENRRRNVTRIEKHGVDPNHWCERTEYGTHPDGRSSFKLIQLEEFLPFSTVEEMDAEINSVINKDNLDQCWMGTHISLVTHLTFPRTWYMEASHICNNPWCTKYEHLVWELPWENRSRSGCHTYYHYKECPHFPRCIICKS